MKKLLTPIQKHFRLIITTILTLTFIPCGNLYAQVNNTINNSLVKKKSSKFTFTVAATTNYVFSQTGSPKSFAMTLDPAGLNNKFVADTYAMDFGFGLLTQAKMTTSKDKKFGIIGTAGFTHFYNTVDNGIYRTRWNIINLGAGIQYDMEPTQKNNPFINFEVDYSLLFGAWQTNVTHPTGEISNIYVKFKPAHRLGIATSMGTNIRTSKRMSILFAFKLAWANIGPKSNNTSPAGYTTYVNDSENSNDIQIDGSKNIIYFQIVTGVNFSLK